ncbi:MAG: pantoate--beta-alanine ligase [Acidobacteriota bacterium]
MADPLARAQDPDSLRAAVAGWRRAGERIAFVPTMGALHAGHLSLVRVARESADRVVTSIFVNPTQFGPGEDLGRYPRTVDEDCRQLEGEGCDLVFLPEVHHVYPPGCQTRVEIEGPSRGFEGAERPGHFSGVATVVLALFQLVRPDVAVFGQKDAQQLAVIRRIVRDLHLGIEIVGAPIVREPDGLALSSRNIYLDSGQRRAAWVLSRSLQQAKHAIEAGERSADAVRQTVRRILETEPSGSIDYVGVVDADTFEPLDRLRGAVVLPVAVRFGSTRLLDNLRIEIEPSG